MFSRILFFLSFGSMLGLCLPASAQSSRLAERFEELDKDDDGRVSAEEFPRGRLFERLDRNGDGFVEPDELPGRAKARPKAEGDFESLLDVAYGEHPRQRLDLYLPSEASGAEASGAEASGAPVMIYVHGGGWKAGDKRAVGEKAAFFTGRGWILVSVNYRLLPEGEHPANVEDVARAIAWVHDHVGEHGGSPQKLFLMGHSAGAHLAALAAVSEAPLAKFGEERAILRGVIPLDTNAYDITELMEGGSRYYRAVFGENPEVWSDASPVTHVEAEVGIPPFLIAYSRGMGARPMPERGTRAESFAETLRVAGISAEVVDASDRNHAAINRRFGTGDDEKVTGAAIRFLDSLLDATASGSSGDAAVETGEGTLDPITLAELDVALQWHVDEENVAGVIGLVNVDGRREYFEAYGMRDRELGEPMPKDAIFRLKSMSKPVVTVAALQLAEEGAFGLDDPIAGRLPEWAEPRVYRRKSGGDAGETVPAEKPITPRMLMTHSSGLYYHLPGRAPFSGMPERDETTTLADFSGALAAQPLLFQPGEDFRYGTSIDVLGRFLEAVTGDPLDVVLRERIFEPLGMVDTDFWVSGEKQDRLAQLYRRDPGGGLAPAAERFSPTRKPALLMGGGGLLGTTRDYERFCRMLLEGGELDGVRILSSESVDGMFANQLADIGKIYGLGGAVDGRGGYAWGGANGTKFWIDRSRRLVAVFMVQTKNYRAPTFGEFQRLVRRAAGISQDDTLRPGGDAPLR